MIMILIQSFNDGKILKLKLDLVYSSQLISLMSIGDLNVKKDFIDILLQDIFLLLIKVE